MPCSSQAATVSSSRFEPPGWMIAVTPAAAATSGPSRNGKKASEASTAPRARSPGLLDGDPDRVEPAHLAGADADELAVLRQHDRVRLDRWQTRQAKARSRSSLVGRRPARSRPCRRPGRPPSRPSPGRAGRPRPAGGRSPTGAGRPGRSGPSRSMQADAVLPGRLGRQQRERVGLEAGGEDRLDEPARLAHPLGRRPVDRPVQADDPAEGADGVALVGQLERLGQVARRSRRRRGCCA